MPEMTRIDVNPTDWERLRSLAKARGATLPALLGSLVLQELAKGAPAAYDRPDAQGTTVINWKTYRPNPDRVLYAGLPREVAEALAEEDAYARQQARNQELG